MSYPERAAPRRPGTVLAAAALLWYVVFPWVEPMIQFDRGTIHEDG